MDNILKWLYVIAALLLLAGCSTVENTLTTLFEKINSRDPLPVNYSQRASENYSSSTPSGQDNYSDANLNKKSGGASSFEEWHNSQF